MTSNRGQVPRAPRWREGLDVSLNTEGADGGAAHRQDWALRQRRGRGAIWLCTQVCVHTNAGTATRAHNRSSENKHVTQSHTYSGSSDNAIRDSLMILEGEVCGRPFDGLSFPLLLPQSLSQTEAEQGRRRARKSGGERESIH